MKILDLSPDDRPREKMQYKGAASLSNAELIAIIIRTGAGGINAVDAARKLLYSVGGSLIRLADTSTEKMMETEGVGMMKALTVSAALELGRRFSMEKISIEKVSITHARMVYNIMIPIMKGMSHEECWVLFLNRANFVTDKERMSSGGMTATVIDTKIIVHKALEKGSSGIILIHNHPSGNPNPGNADIVQTTRLREALKTFDISLVDHVIISDDRFFSFADERLEIIE